MVLSEVFNNLELQRIKYFLKSNRCSPLDILSYPRDNANKIIDEKIAIATNIITKQLENNNKLDEWLKAWVSELHPNYKHNLDENLVSIYEIILFYMLYEFDVSRVIGGDIEIIPADADDRYKIVKLDKGEIFTHEGVKYNGKFYYFSPTLLDYKVVQYDEPTELIKLLSEQNSKNDVWLRLDDNLSILANDYIPNMIGSYELYRGQIINLENIEFPYNKTNIILSSYNPTTMKRIQFKLSTLNEKQNWIEVEELFDYSDKKDNYVTKYLHSIYDSDKDSFNHIDGSINFYNKDTYKRRTQTTINSHADRHEKLWLIEGEISKGDWLKLTYMYFNDDDLISDAFHGNLSEEVLEEIITN